MELTFGLLLLVVAFAMFVLYMVPIRLWVSAAASGAYISLISLVGMRLRRIPPKVIVEPRISAVRAGLEIKSDDLESHYLAGGDVNKVVLALISADKAGIELTFQRASAIDLAGRDVLEAVKMSVNPKVINTPVVAAVHGACKIARLPALQKNTRLYQGRVFFVRFYSWFFLG